MSVEITIRDTETGESETKTIVDDYLIITAGRHYVASVQKYATGTSVLTVKADS